MRVAAARAREAIRVKEEDEEEDEEALDRLRGEPILKEELLVGSGLKECRS